MKLRIWHSVLSCILMLVPIASQAASFDCDKASTEVERLICATPELSSLDDGLSKAYKEARLRASDIDSLLAEQKIWIRGRNGCRTVECLKNSYSTRIQQLSGNINQTEHSNLKEEIHRPIESSQPDIAAQEKSSEASLTQQMVAPLQPERVYQAQAEDQKNSLKPPDKSDKPNFSERKKSDNDSAGNDSGKIFLNIFRTALIFVFLYLGYRFIKNRRSKLKSSAEEQTDNTTEKKGGWKGRIWGIFKILIILGLVGNVLKLITSGTESGSSSSISIVGDWQCDQLVHNFRTDRAMKAREYLTFNSNGTWIDARNDSGKYNVKTGEISLVTKRSENIGSIVKLEKDRLEFMLNHGNVNSTYYCQRKLATSNESLSSQNNVPSAASQNTARSTTDGISYAIQQLESNPQPQCQMYAIQLKNGRDRIANIGASGSALEDQLYAIIAKAERIGCI